MLGWAFVAATATTWDVLVWKHHRDQTLSAVAGRHPFITSGFMIAGVLHFNFFRYRQWKVCRAQAKA